MLFLSLFVLIYVFLSFVGAKVIIFSHPSNFNCTNTDDKDRSFSQSAILSSSDFYYITKVSQVAKDPHVLT